MQVLIPSYFLEKWAYDQVESEDSVKQNYELAFHIKPSIEEAKMLSIKGALENIITAGGGIIAFAKVPEKQRLSYEIQHERSSWFGYIHFSLTDKETLNRLEDHIRLDKDIMRHILLKLETDAQKQKAVVRAAEHKERLERRAKKVREETGTKDVKEMEKQLEEVIEGL